MKTLMNRVFPILTAAMMHNKNHARSNPAKMGKTQNITQIEAIFNILCPIDVRRTWGTVV
jgi:hypothetical protein